MPFLAKESNMSAMDKLMAAVKNAKAGGSGAAREEDYFYYPARDATGVGQAVLQFLPGVTVDDVPFVKTFSHGFNVKRGDQKKWLIDECPTTIGNDCPTCAANKVLWDTGLKENQEIVRERKRKVSYVSRVLVIEDKKNPDNEGKVFLFKYGQKIFDKIADALSPEDEADKKYNVFGLSGAKDPWPVFRFRIRKVEGQTNYDKSAFESAEDFKTDYDFKSQFSEANDINKFVAPARFKSYEDLQKRLDYVLGNTARLAAQAAPQSAMDRAEASEPVVERAAPAKAESTRREVAKPTDSTDDDVMNLVMSIASGTDGSTPNFDDDIPF